MNSRRRFLQNALLGTSAITVLPSFTSSAQALAPHQLSVALANTASEEEFWKTIRLQFPLKEGQTYFNNGTMGAMPSYVLERVMEDMRYSAVHAAETDYKGEGPELLTGYFEYRQLREKLGKIINADYKAISLTQNATFGMNFIANGLDLKSGDEVINTNQEHGGGFAAWQQLAKRKGLVYKQAILPVPSNDKDELITAVLKEITPKTRIIAIPHIVSVYGTILPVKEICEEARRRGIFTIIDGAQSIGQIAVDVNELGCDAYYSSLHKWLLAPAGNGLLYIRPDQAENIWCTLASYNWENKDDHGFRLQQYGSGNPSLLVGLEAAVDFYNTIGERKWLSRVKYLGNYLRDGLLKMPHVAVHGPVNDELCAGISTYAVKGISGPDVQKILWQKERLQPRSVGNELVRHSTHIYNSPEEIDRSLAVLRDMA